MLILDDYALHVSFVNKGLHLFHQIPSEHLYFFYEILECHLPKFTPAVGEKVFLSIRTGEQLTVRPTPMSNLPARGYAYSNNEISQLTGAKSPD